MKFVYITALIDIVIVGKMQAPFELKKNTYISNNPSHIKKFIRPPDAMALGSLEVSLLFSGAPVMYQLDEVAKVEDVHEEIINHLREVQAFLTSLWLLRDNSANCELGFAISQPHSYVHSNSLALNYCASSGARSSIEIDHDELTRRAVICRNNFQGIRTEDELEGTAFQKESGRLGVSMRLLQQARSSMDLGQKIANYCSYFEALLSTSSAELSHQLSERAAFLLRATPKERFEHFKKTKRAYAIRSKVVHGDIVSKKLIPDLKDIAAHCDETARELLTLIIDSDQLKTLFNGNDSDALDNFMLGKIFGVDVT